MKTTLILIGLIVNQASFASAAKYECKGRLFADNGIDYQVIVIEGASYQSDRIEDFLPDTLADRIKGTIGSRADDLEGDILLSFYNPSGETHPVASSFQCNFDYEKFSQTKVYRKHVNYISVLNQYHRLRNEGFNEGWDLFIKKASVVGETVIAGYDYVTDQKSAASNYKDSAKADVVASVNVKDTIDAWRKEMSITTQKLSEVKKAMKNEDLTELNQF